MAMSSKGLSCQVLSWFVVVCNGCIHRVSYRIVLFVTVVPMSIRAGLISFYLRRTIKKQMASLEDPAVMRESQNGGLASKPPEQMLTAVVDAGGVNAEWVSWLGVAEDKVLLYLHGGGYVFGGPDSHRDLAWRLAKESGVRVLVVDYRLAPEHPFPAALDDATRSYRWLLEQGIAPENISVAGDSAGGGLAAALVLNLTNLGVKLPKAVVMISPWADLAMTGDSMKTNADKDAMLSPEAISRFANFYLGDSNPKAPLASPVFADLSGFPPALILVGSTEVLLSDAETIAQKINDSGGLATLEIWPKMPHVFPLFAGIIPEGKAAVSQISEFLRSHMGTSALD